MNVIFTSFVICTLFLSKRLPKYSQTRGWHYCNLIVSIVASIWTESGAANRFVFVVICSNSKIISCFSNPTSLHPNLTGNGGYQIILMHCFLPAAVGSEGLIYLGLLSDPFLANFHCCSSNLYNVVRVALSWENWFLCSNGLL